MNFKMKKRGNITIDGRDFIGRSVVINNNKVTIDGVQQEGELIGDINITVNGDIEKLENESGTVKARNIESASTMSGDIECGNITGSVSTMSGNIDCEDIGGGCSTMSGNIKYKK